MSNEETEERYVEITNIGPIKKATIQLRPLTIIVGPNNSGKSFAAILLHSLVDLLSMVSNEIWLLKYYPRIPPHNPPLEFDMLPPAEPLMEQASCDVLRSSLLQSEDGDQWIDLPEEMIIELMEGPADDLCEDFKKVLENRFGADTRDLLRIGTRKAHIKSKLSDIPFTLVLKRSKWTFELERPLPTFKVKLDGSRVFLHFRNSVKVVNFSRYLIPDEKDVLPQKAVDFVAFNIAALFMKCLKTDTISGSLFLPSSRSGIFQMRNVLTELILRQFPEKEPFPQGVSGIVTNLLARLFQIGASSKKQFYEIAYDFENELKLGHIESTEPDVPMPYHLNKRQIRYRRQNRNIPFVIASSTVTELAPIILSIKYLLDAHSFLMIEEPEAHLHPDNQRALAELLVKLVNEDVYVLITTHSEYLVNELSLYVQASGLSEGPSDLQKFIDHSLQPHRVSIHRAILSEDGLASKIEPQTVDAQGIDQGEFIKARRSQFSDTVKVERAVDGE